MFLEYTPARDAKRGGTMEVQNPGKCAPHSRINFLRNNTNIPLLPAVFSVFLLAQHWVIVFSAIVLQCVDGGGL